MKSLTGDRSALFGFRKTYYFDKGKRCTDVSHDSGRVCRFHVRDLIDIMARSRFAGVVAGLLVACLFAAPATAHADQVWKVYDVRDLLTLIDPPIPEEAREVPRSDKADGSFLADSFGHQVSPSQNSKVAASEKSADKLDSLIGKICFAQAINCERLLPGVYMVDGEEAMLVDFERMLKSVRNLYDKPFELALVWFRTAVTDSLSVGAVIEKPKSHRRQHLVVFDSTPVDIRVGSSITYVADVTAVVAEHASTHEPVIGTIHEGLFASAIVTSQEREEQSVLVRLAGEFRDVQFSERSTRELKEAGIPLLQLPQVRRRSLQAAVPVELNKLTVIDIVDDFSDDSSLVLAARVRIPGKE